MSENRATFYRPSEQIPGWVNCDWCHLTGEPEHSDWHDEHCPVMAVESSLAQAQADVETLREVQQAAQNHINAVRYQLEIEDEPHTHRLLSERLAALSEHLRGASR